MCKFHRNKKCEVCNTNIRGKTTFQNKLKCADFSSEVHCVSSNLCSLGIISLSLAIRNYFILGLNVSVVKVQVCRSIPT